MKFRLLALLMALVLLFAACGEKTDTEQETQNETQTEAVADDLKGEVGETVAYEITNVYCNKQLLPESTEGFYKYYEASEGNTFFIVEADLTNTSDRMRLIWSIAEAKLEIGGKEYTEVQIAVDLGQDNSYGNGNVSIDPEQEYHVYYLFDIPTDTAHETAVFSLTANDETVTHELKVQA